MAASGLRSRRNWVTGDKALTRKLVEDSSAAYAAEKKITPACMK
jgi:branched-chain amino acid transport system substrate-binding protein